MDSVGLLLQSPVSDVLTLAQRLSAGAALYAGRAVLPDGGGTLRRSVGTVPPRAQQETARAGSTVRPARHVDLITYAGERGPSDLELHFVDRPLNRAAYRRWRRRPDRPRFQGGSPFAMVGMFGPALY